MRKGISTILTAGLLSMATGSAFGFSLAGGYTGEVVIKFSNWSDGKLYTESSDGYGQADGTGDAYGIFKIFTFRDNVGNTLWSDGKDGQELTGVYYGIDDDYWTVDAFGNLNIQSVGGRIDIYLDDAQNFSPIMGPTGAHTDLDSGGSWYDTVTDGTLFLALEFVPGIKFGDGDPATDHITYDNNLDGTTSPFTGDGAFYMNVIGGAYAWMFDSNFITKTDNSGNIHKIDMFAQFDTVAPGDFGWLVNSEDPVRAFVIPEPISMVTFGMGLLGFMGFGMKRKKLMVA